MAAKNAGLKVSSAPYVYFGDDDSVLTHETIEALLKEIAQHPTSIIAARHIYMSAGESIAEVIQQSKAGAPAVDGIFDPETMRLDLRHITPENLRIPFCQACFLAPGHIARSKSFDESYIGTCFREETDYIISLRKQGLGLRVCNAALQINLPRSVAAGGGTSSVNILFRHFSEVVNEFRFFSKHGDYLQSYVKFSCSPLIRAASHALKKLARLVVNGVRVYIL